MSLLEKDFQNSRDNVSDIISKKTSGSNFSSMFKIRNVHSVITTWAIVCQKEIKENGEFAKVYAENLLEMISEVEEDLQNSLKNLS